MASSIQPASSARYVALRPAFAHPEIDVSGERLANPEPWENRCGNHVGFNHARFNSAQHRRWSLMIDLVLSRTFGRRHPCVAKNGQTQAHAPCAKWGLGKKPL